MWVRSHYKYWWLTDIFLAENLLPHQQRKEMPLSEVHMWERQCSTSQLPATIKISCNDNKLFSSCHKILKKQDIKRISCLQVCLFHPVQILFFHWGRKTLSWQVCILLFGPSGKWWTNKCHSHCFHYPFQFILHNHIPISSDTK
jgi:hypothetical protein